MQTVHVYRNNISNLSSTSASEMINWNDSVKEAKISTETKFESR